FEGNEFRNGASGTLYLKSDTQAFGELTLDNAAVSTTATIVPSIGSGSVSSVAGSTFTDNAKTFPFSVVGLSIDFKRAGVFLKRYTVVAQSGKTLTLDSAVARVVQAGHAYRGVLKLANLIVRNGAILSTTDFVEGFNNPPTATLSTTTPNPILPGRNIVIKVVAADDFGLATVVLRSTGAAIFNQSQGSAGLSATQNLFRQIPATAVDD